MTSLLRPPTWRDLLLLAWPIIISRSTQAVVGFTDAAMVGPLGEASLAATTAGATNTFTLLILPMGVTFVVSTFVSQYKGAGDLQAARRFAFYGLLVALFTELLCLASMPFAGAAIGLMPYTPEVQDLMVGYLLYRLPSGGFAIGLEVFGNYYGGLGNTRLPMLSQVFAMVLNIFLNWILIYGNLGAPAMGVEGAALASSLATGAAFLLLLGLFWAGVGHEGRPSRLRGAELWKVITVGLPSGLNWFIEFGAFSFFINFVLAGLGTTTVAALMAGMQINSISFMPAFALASAGSILAGQQIGAQRKDDVPRTARLTLAAAGLWQGITGVLYLAIPGVLLAPFAAEEGSSFLVVGAEILAISAAWQLFDSVVATYAEILRAAGDTAFTFYARALIAWFVFVPGAWYTTQLGYQHVAALAWIVIYLGILGGVLYWRFRGGKWRSIVLTEGSFHH